MSGSVAFVNKLDFPDLILSRTDGFLRRLKLKSVDNRIKVGKIT